MKYVAVALILAFSNLTAYVAGQTSIRKNLIVVDIWNGVPDGSRGGILSKGFYGKCATVGEAVYCATLDNQK